MMIWTSVEYNVRKRTFLIGTLTSSHLCFRLVRLSSANAVNSGVDVGVPHSSPLLLVMLGIVIFNEDGGCLISGFDRFDQFFVCF